MQEVGGSIPPGSTIGFRNRSLQPMLRFGRMLIYLAVLLVLIGMALGFGALFTGRDGIALTLLSLVPVGVLLGFAGLVILVMLEPRH